MLLYRVHVGGNLGLECSWDLDQAQALQYGVWFFFKKMHFIFIGKAGFFYGEERQKNVPSAGQAKAKTQDLHLGLPVEWHGYNA